MTRRRQKSTADIAMGVAQLFGLLLVVGLFLPQTRPWVSGHMYLITGVVFLIAIAGFAAFVLWRTRKTSSPSTPPPQPGHDSRITDIPASAGGFIVQLRRIDWFQFEMVVAQIYRKLGYTVARRGGARPDGGIDLVIEKDGQCTAIQCKHWKSWNIGVKTVREFLGALTDQGVAHGVIITLGGCTDEASQLAGKHGIEIVSETELAGMVKDAGIENDADILTILSDTRKTCPKCESEMVLRTATKGTSAGRPFWGCTAYPKCRFTMPV